MSDDFNRPTDTPPASDPTKPTSTPPKADQDDSPDLVNELRDMGQQLESMLRAFVESDRAKQLQRDLSGGVREITKQVQLALKSAQDNERFQKAEERGRNALNQAQQSKLVNDVQETLVSGIAQLNLQIKRVSERLDQDTTAAASSTTTQQVPIEVDETQPAMPPFERFEQGGPDVTAIPGVTGETQRLDIDDETKA